MKETTILINELTNEIKNDVNLSREFITLLESERTSLEKKDIEQIEKLAAKKTSLILAFSKNQKSRDDIQQQLGGPIGFQGLRYILEKFKLQQHPTFKIILQDLEKLLIKIQNMSDINSKIIAISHAQTSRIIDILYGRDNQIYGENAKVCSTGVSKSITKV